MRATRSPRVLFEMLRPPRTLSVFNLRIRIIPIFSHSSPLKGQTYLFSPDTARFCGGRYSLFPD